MKNTPQFLVGVLLFISSSAFAKSGVVLFMSDFGLLDDAVPICKGVMHEIAPEVKVIDVTHQIVPYNIRQAAVYLANMTPYYAPGTVFVTVVDPGVGSERRSVVAKSKKGHYFVGPDNGLLTFIQDQDGIEELREITNQAWFRKGTMSVTFHGKDVYTPVAAYLARGEDFKDVGPVVQNPVRLKVTPPNGGLGEVMMLDGPYGNLITNLTAADLKKLGYTFGDTAKVRVGKKKIDVRVSRMFSDVPVGKPLLYLDWHDRVCFAVNQGSFAKSYKADEGTAVELSAKGAK